MKNPKLLSHQYIHESRWNILWSRFVGVMDEEKNQLIDEKVLPLEDARFGRTSVTEARDICADNNNLGPGATQISEANTDISKNSLQFNVSGGVVNVGDVSSYPITNDQAQEQKQLKLFRRSSTRSVSRTSLLNSEGQICDVFKDCSSEFWEPDASRATIFIQNMFAKYFSLEKDTHKTAWQRVLEDLDNTQNQFDQEMKRESLQGGTSALTPARTLAEGLNLIETDPMKAINIFLKARNHSRRALDLVTDTHLKIKALQIGVTAIIQRCILSQLSEETVQHLVENWLQEINNRWIQDQQINLIYNILRSLFTLIIFSHIASGNLGESSFMTS